MSIVYIALASIALLSLLLWGLNRSVSSPAVASRDEIVAELRALLLARSEGRIEEAEFVQRQGELHAALLIAPVPLFRQPKVLIGGGVVALAAAGIALTVLSSRKVEPVVGLEMAAKLSEPGNGGNAQANSGGDLNTVAKRLADKLAADPSNGEGWALLAKTYSELHRYADAAAAYAKADTLLRSDAGMLADWADVQVMAHEGKWDDDARKLVKRAVAADGKHVKALALSGSEAFDRKDYKAAIDFWKRMKVVVAPDSMDARLADANIAEAEALRSGKKPGNAEPGAISAQLAGVVTLAPKLVGRVATGDTVFVVAKPLEGGAPLAVGRYKGNDFPIEFHLDDSNAVIPGKTLSQHGEVLVSARVSRSGNAEPVKGDLLSAPVKVRIGKTTLVLELDSER